MNLFTYILLFIVIICFILIWMVSVYNKFQNYIIRINEAEVNIDSILRKRFDLLNKSISIIKSNCDINKVLNIIDELRSQKLSNFELDRKLYDAINEFHNYIERYPKLKTVENFMKINISLSESETEIEAFRKYYNDIITDYNKLVRSFPSLIVAMILKYKVKTYFDGKNMYDKNIKDFKL